MSIADSSDDSLLSQLDWKSQEILRAVYENGGRATTSEIKQRTAITDNDHITHRCRRAAVALEPAGLITVADAEKGSPQRNPPLEITLTEQGELLAKRISDRDGRPTEIDQRLERVETTLTALETTVDEQYNETETSEDTGDDDLDARLTTIEQRLDQLEETLDGEYGAWSAEKQHEHAVFGDGFRAMRDLLLDKHEDEFKQYISKYEN